MASSAACTCWERASISEYTATVRIPGACRSGDADGDFPPVGNQDFLEHGSPLTTECSRACGSVALPACFPETAGCGSAAGGGPRKDHVVDVAPLGGQKGIREVLR